ncbi:MAG: hypothetical protein ABSC55_26845 [Syntrophorhabdales bacterium]|jgi:hypothetical protein
MQKDRYCAYFYGDILGYKELLLRKSVSKLAEDMRSAISAVDQIVQPEQAKIEAGRSDPLTRQYFRWAANGLIGSYCAFDTIVIFFKDISYDTLNTRFEDFLELCSSLYLSFLIGSGLKLRGVISITKSYVIDEHLFLVDNISRAFELEKAQEWSGIVVDFPDGMNLDWGYGPLADDHLIFYEVPTKTGRIEYPVLNPVNKGNIQFLRTRSWSLLKAIESLYMEMQTAKTNIEAAQKLKNTYDFMMYAKHYYEGGLKVERKLGSVGVEFNVP